MDKINKLIDEKYQDFKMSDLANNIRDKHISKSDNILSLIENMSIGKLDMFTVSNVFISIVFLAFLQEIFGSAVPMYLRFLSFIFMLVIINPVFFFISYKLLKIAYNFFNKEKVKKQEKQNIITLAKKAEDACYSCFLEQQINNDIINFLKIDLSLVEYNIFSVLYPSKTYGHVLKFYNDLPNIQKEIEDSNQEKISLSLTKEDIKRFSIV